MKKLIALLLAILMIASISLVACNNKKGTTGNNGGGDDVADSEDNGLVIPDAPISSETTGEGSDTTGTNGANNNTNTGFENVVSFSVYTYVRTSVRSSAMMKASVVTTVDASAQLTVLAKNGSWYKVKYGTEEGYVPQDFVTTNRDDTVFTDFEEADRKVIKIKANTEDPTQPFKVNIRQYPIVSDFLTQTVKEMDSTKTANGELVQLGVNASGTWYKVAYDNGVYYLRVSNSTRPYLIVGGQALDTEAGGI